MRWKKREVKKKEVPCLCLVNCSARKYQKIIEEDGVSCFHRFFLYHPYLSTLPPSRFQSSRDISGTMEDLRSLKYKEFNFLELNPLSGWIKFTFNVNLLACQLQTDIRALK
eukprot:TRINITY_DN9393_c0_g1_i1.p1 TRINITY_DN9393_c0_g1~~TRINITY_DN9393_c0_g1_i1.p1  ORF type:complete len:111 (-),score=23.63 TRINITY_DN9393_c0_g1_i1:408-740(-)